ncbi:indolepyruvate ferredoxin oxidoreductase family protein [Vitreimonas flagellata]|uniref:indolepyruvate ferredoxin oxidoreductase family protein n=1 Tax=Vitreimonas flagellata TaxID=2560861 RepID=UPI00107504E3|nr:indolepyruvate ferredoxin oxidoreductase family protein [Vitreimonas flagellata]
MIDASIKLEDAFDRATGRVYMTGMQALVRLALLQAESDKKAGLNTAGLISGYRGSPLGGFDTEIDRNKKRLSAANVLFQTGLNEDLAATALLGTQQAQQFGTARYDGVFSMWYGKGPGVDRSGDAFKHGLRAGTSEHGGVLVAFGDDHAGKSSTVAHQSDPSLAALGMPVLNPATLEEVMQYGLYGWAASRFSGLWVGLKCVNETAEATGVVDIGAVLRPFVKPQDVELPPGGLNLRIAFDVVGDETRHIRYRLPAIEAWARANPIDRALGAKNAPLGVVTSGKSYLDVLDALRLLELDEAGPVAVYKVGQIYPLERQGIMRFASGKRELAFIEEKTGLVEQQALGFLFNMAEGQRPRVVGKLDEKGQPLAPMHGVMDARDVAIIIGERLQALGLATESVSQRVARLRESKEAQASGAIGKANRTPWFCSGCPHNTSTKAPEGSKTLTGIGCHTMAIWMERDALPPAQMGGEGANWIGMAPFVNTEHVFQNLGDGTYNHSGLLAIRAAVATNTRITYKILFNDAVAMTGGQKHDGQLTVGDIVRQVQAERVDRVVVVAEDPSRVSGPQLPADVALYHRDRMDEVQRELREQTGVTVLIYDQTCASVLRRQRKRGLAETPSRRVVINERVCEGCGDCSVQSNCTSVIPKPTEFGLKRAIDQSSCNRDFSCVKGFCPSFVELDGAEPAARAAQFNVAAALAAVPAPEYKPHGDITNVLVAGIGGTGVVTVGALIGMAAHLEGGKLAAYDMTGLAQKGGAVYSHVRITKNGVADEFGPRLPPHGCDVLIGCEAQVSVAGDAIASISAGRTIAFLNEDVLAPGAFQIGAPVALTTDGYRATLDSVLGAGTTDAVPATDLAKTLLGDAVYANVMMLGYAFQKGALPLTAEAIERAIELNGASVAKNKAAFHIGRIAAYDLKMLPGRKGAEPVPDLTLDELIERRAAFLTAYQDEAYAARFRELVSRVRAAASASGAGEAFPRAVVENFSKLMAYKDEYEVARLYSDGAFRAQLAQDFSEPRKVSLYLSPPLIAPKDKRTGHAKKIKFGPWVFPVLEVLAKFKGLRGKSYDPIGWTAERREERRLIVEYESTIADISARLNSANAAIATDVARVPEEIRGFGHVKERSLKHARARRARLLQRFEAKSSAGSSAATSATAAAE